MDLIQLLISVQFYIPLVTSGAPVIFTGIYSK